MNKAEISFMWRAALGGGPHAQKKKKTKQSKTVCLGGFAGGMNLPVYLHHRTHPNIALLMVIFVTLCCGGQVPGLLLVQTRSGAALSRHPHTFISQGSGIQGVRGLWVYVTV